MPRKKATPHVREAHAAYVAEAPALEPVPAAEAQDTPYVSERDWDILMDLVENPPPPGEALLQTLRHHRDFVRSFDHPDVD